MQVATALDPLGLLVRFQRPIRFGVVGVIGASVNSALLFTFITRVGGMSCSPER
jgi:putative flippase GtrA